MGISPHMSPQLNETVCSCHCGCGCGCAGHGIVNDGDRMSDTDTAVDLDDSDSEDSPIGQQTHDGDFDDHHLNVAENGVHSPRALSHQEIVWFLATVLHRLENFQLVESLESWEEMNVRPPLHDDYEGTGEGLQGGYFSPEDCSNAISGRGSVRVVSPGPGIGGWVQVIPENTQRVYIFNPLRLSVEYQHARGTAV